MEPLHSPGRGRQKWIEKVHIQREAKSWGLEPNPERPIRKPIRKFAGLCKHNWLRLKLALTR